MIKRARRWFGLTVLAACLAGSCPAMALPADQGPGLDLIVLVDRSTSMLGLESGAGDRPQMGDLLDLTLSLLAWNAESNRVSHRLGVVSFGSMVRIDLPLSRVERDGLVSLRSRLAVAPSGVSLGNTDVLAAFAAAAKMFQSVPAQPLRSRGVLVITDGIPHVAGKTDADYDRELRQFVSAHFSPGGTSIDIVILSKRGIPDYPRYARLWRDLAGGRIHEVVPDRELSLAAVHQVVTQLVGTRVVESRPAAGEVSLETLVVPPYLDLVVFDVLHGPRAAKVDIFAPDTLGPLTAGAQGVEQIQVGETLWTVVVRRPAPGLWRFRKLRPDARVKILAQQFFPRGLLVEPNADELLRQFDPVAIGYKIVDGDGLPLREIPGYPLSLELSLRKPDGQRAALAMERQPNRDAILFRTREASECDLAGRYWTELQIITRDLAARRLEVFRDRWSGFSVEAASRIDCQIMAPYLGGPILRRRLLWAEPVATRLECRDRNAKPFELKSIVRGSPTKLFQPILSLGGQRTDADLDLEYLGRGTFSGSLHGAGFPGFYRLQFRIDRSQLTGPYTIRFLPLATTFIRYLSWPDVLLTLVIAEALLVYAVKMGRSAWRRRIARIAWH
jgi:VWA domain-containing protein